MIKFTKHIPNFVDLDEPPPVLYFNTEEELLEHPDIQRWKRNGDRVFHQFSVLSEEEEDESECTLIIECDGGYWWWVLGYVDQPTLNLPEWEPKYE